MPLQTRRLEALGFQLSLDALAVVEGLALLFRQLHGLTLGVDALLAEAIAAEEQLVAESFPALDAIGRVPAGRVFEFVHGVIQVVGKDQLRNFQPGNLAFRRLA
jgi:hypothetical protein